MHVPPLAVFGSLAINFSRLTSPSIKTGLLSVVAAELFYFIFSKPKICYLFECF